MLNKILEADELVNDLYFLHTVDQVDDPCHVYDYEFIDEQNFSYLHPAKISNGGDQDFDELLYRYSILRRLIDTENSIRRLTVNSNIFRQEINRLYLDIIGTGENIFPRLPIDHRHSYSFLCQNCDHTIAEAIAWQKENYKCLRINGTVSYYETRLGFQMIFLFSKDNFPKTVEISSFTEQPDRHNRRIRTLNGVMKIPNIARPKELLLFDGGISSLRAESIAGTIFTLTGIVFDAISSGSWHPIQ